MKNQYAKSAVISILVLFSAWSLCPAEVPAPETFLGFKAGEDFKLADWSQILGYFDILAQKSSKVRLEELGLSTKGRRFVMAVISSPDNLNRLDAIKTIQKKLHDPRNLSFEEEKQLIEQGKAVVLIACSIHSTEIAASQMSMELAYKLVTEDSPAINQILDEVVLLLIPSVNPDGIDIVTDWYRRNINTPFEASRLPWLYHYYVGHDNNRDWFMFTQKESRLEARVLYQEWFPLLVYDIHQMGSSGARFFIPPYHDPVNPNLDSLLIREMNVLTGIAAAELTRHGKTGVATNAIFDTWYTAANRAAPLRHNMIGILSEAASANLASPIYLRKDQIHLSSRGFFGDGIQSSYLEPWPGGWWRLRDIIEYEEITAFSFLRTFASRRTKYLKDFVLYGRRQAEKGQTEPPFAYLLPPDQKDLPTSYKMLQILRMGGVEVHKAAAAFTADEVEYPAGTFVILLSQPYRAFVKDLMERKAYPMRTGPSGKPEMPYDEASWTLPLQMGVRTIEVISPFKADLEIVLEVEIPKGKIEGRNGRYAILPNTSTHDAILVNRLHKKDIPLWVAAQGFRLGNKHFPPGAVIFDTGRMNGETLLSLIRDLGISLVLSTDKPQTELKPLKKPLIGVYQSWLADRDEGWLRWTLEKFEFPFKIVHNAEIRGGNLHRTYSHIILPGQSESSLLEGASPGSTLPEYSGGIGLEGVSALHRFVHEGGSLLALNQASDFAISHFGLPAKNIITPSSRWWRMSSEEEKGGKHSEVFCPGSLLTIRVAESRPFGYGSMGEGVIFSYFSPVFEADQEYILAAFPSYNPLLSGICLNEKNIREKAAALEFTKGKGKVYLLGFKPIHRAQAHGSFKFLFNLLLFS
ncbi:MAG: peptidase M14 [Candidatus Aminicenantes bacterium]|nr:peptidase M14 [Candidatus Aminicenantes bacterium]